MADERTYNVEDRIRELNEDPATAYANAKANGTAGDAAPPTDLGINADPLSSTEYPSVGTVADGVSVPASPPHRGAKPDPYAGTAGAIVDKYAPANTGDRTPLQLAKGSTDPQDPGSGSIADAVSGQAIPEGQSAPWVTNPAEPESSWSDLVHAHDHSDQRDNYSFHDKMILAGYAPIVRALGLPDSENPGRFAEVDPSTSAQFGIVGSPSQLATNAGKGELVPFTNNRLANRDLQEQLLVDLIHQRRAKDPNFAPGVPDTVAGLRASFIADQHKGEADEQRVIAHSPGGLTGFSAALVGGGIAGARDPLNDLAFAIPGGEGGTLLRVAARDMIINGVLAAAMQPVVAANKKEMGEDYSAGDAISNVGSAAAFGAVLGAASHGFAKTGIPQAVGKGIGATVNGVGRGADAIVGTTADFLKVMPEAVRAKWGGRVKDSEPVSSFFSTLTNHELVDLAHDATGGKLTEDEQAAINVVQRAQDIGESSPYQPGPAGDGTHENNVAQAMKALDDHQLPETTGFPSVPVASGSDAASPAAVAERAPAPSTVGRPHRFELRNDPEPATDPETAIERFIPKVYHAENNSGNIHAQNPHSTASGPAQFTDGTFQDYYKKVYGTDPGKHADRELKDNPEIQHNLLLHLTRDNAASLQKLGETVNSGNLYLMHVLGAGDGPKVFKADPSTPIEQLLSHDVLERNPYLQGKSASEVIAWAHGRMGEHISSVRSGAGPLEAATDDPRLAQLNEEALQAQNAVVASDAPIDWGTSSSSSAEHEAALDSATAAEPIKLPPMTYETFRPHELAVDADRFQFKSGGDEHGVTERLQGVQQWNPLAANRLIAWQDNEGRNFVVDGHQRSGLARRLEAQGHPPIPLDAVVLHERDGVTAEEARAAAAFANIAGTDTNLKARLVDAAKAFKSDPARVRAMLPPKSMLVRDGPALSTLSDAAFGHVFNERIAPDIAAVVGHILPHRPEAHEAMVDLLMKLDPPNRSQAEHIVRQALAAGLHKEEQIDLFGTHEHVTTLMLEKAKLTEKVLGWLSKMKLVHKTAAEGAETLERTGSKIAKSASEKEAKANAQAIETVNRLSYRAGPIADIINAAAADLKSGRANLATLARNAAEQIRRLDIAELDRVAANDPDAGEQFGFLDHSDSDAERAAAAAHSGDGEPVGRADGSELADLAGEPSADTGTGGGADGEPGGFNFGEESPELSTQSGDPDEPGLHELEQATERFSDPNGKAAQDQAESLHHDLKAEVSRREQILEASKQLEGVRRGEFKSVAPFADEPGYHRFRYVDGTGKVIGGNYSVRGDTIDNFAINSDDFRNQNKVGPKAMMSLFEQLHAEHPEVEYLHGYRKSGSRVVMGSGPKDVWFHLGDNGVRLLDGPPDAFDKFTAALDQTKLVSPVFKDMSDREVAEMLAHDMMTEAVNEHAVKQGRQLDIADEKAADQLHKDLSDRLMGDAAGDGDLIKRQVAKAIKDGRLPLEDLGEPEHVGPNEAAMAPSSIEAPEATVKSADYAGPEISPAEAKARLEGWKAEAQRIGRESPPPPNHVILSLFDTSGVWSKPYEEMGYKVVRLDLKSGHDLLREMGNYMLAIDKAKEDGLHFAGVLAQPPCTTFASSGARWWGPRHNRKWDNVLEKMFGSWAAKNFESPVEYNQFLVMATQEYIHRAEPDFYAIENPNGRIAELTGLPKPQLVVQPHHFGDPYTKWTNLWGKFDPELETANVHPAEGSRAHNLRGRDEKDDGLRSQTPEGLAYAFALANHPGAGEDVARAVGEHAAAAADPPAIAKVDQGAAAAVAKRFGLTEQEVGNILSEPLNVLRERDRYLAPSNTKEPTTDFEKLPIGAAKVDLYGEPKDAYVGVLREFDPKSLKPTEGGGDDPRVRPSIERYADFTRAGNEPPPVSVTPGRGDTPFFSQNRRRVLAAQEAGAESLKGWLSTDNPETNLPLKYGDVRKAYEEELGHEPEPAKLDLGAQTDPAIADRQAQEVALKAAASLQAPGHVDQLGEIGLPLMDNADQIKFRIGEEGDEISAADLLKDLDDDAKAIKAMKDCL